MTRFDGHWPIFALLLTTFKPTFCRLNPRSVHLEPISISSSQYWDGDDGPWSSFIIQLGTPIQNVRVFVSTALSETWVVSGGDCFESQTVCNEDRGRTFAPWVSSTWHQVGDYALGVSQELGSQLNGTFGHENYTLGLQGSGGPALPYQAVVAYTSQNLNLGMFGLNPFAGKESGSSGNFLTSLKNQSRIPSASFGYTAGNQYRLKKVYGSLTLGGYDASLITPNTLKVPFSGSDPSRYLQIAIQSITSIDQGGKTAALLPTPITANVDSTSSMIWLPLAACKAFEDTFSLKWDQKTDLYLVSDDLHSQLTEQNASVTFQFSNQTSGGQSTGITLPYASFDLFVKPPFAGVSSNQRYFPLRRAANESQYTLGRTLLQEAYLTVDWDRRHFSLQQCNYTTDIVDHDFVPIYTPGEEPKIPVSTGAKAGIGVGVAIGLLLSIGLASWILWRRRRARRRLAKELAKSGINPKEGMIRHGLAKGEMGAGIDNALYEMEGSDGNALKPYGGQAPPWVDEKGRYPGLGFSPDAVAEIDGVSRRAELGGAVGFYGGRGVHEMYDPSSVRPIELPASRSEAPTPYLKNLGSTEDFARTLPRRPLSAGRASATHSSLFSLFSRKPRGTSNADGNSSSGISGPSTQASPKHADQAIGTRGQTSMVSVHQPLPKSTTPRLVPHEERPPPVPPRDYKPLPRPQVRSINTISSASTKYQDSDLESNKERTRAPSSDRRHVRDDSLVDRAQLSRRSDAQQSSRPSLPSAPISPHTISQIRVRGESHAYSDSSASKNGDEVFSPLSRQGTAKIFSPVSPDNEDGRSHQKGHLGGFRSFR